MEPLDILCSESEAVRLNLEKLESCAEGMTSDGAVHDSFKANGRGRQPFMAWDVVKSLSEVNQVWKDKI